MCVLVGSECNVRPQLPQADRHTHPASQPLTPPLSPLPLSPLPNRRFTQFPYTEAVFAESLRLYPPAHTTNRHAPDGLCLGRVTIPKGAMVFL